MALLRRGVFQALALVLFTRIWPFAPKSPDASVMCPTIRLLLPISPPERIVMRRA